MVNGFLDPYSMNKLLAGVIQANSTVRGNFLQNTFFNDVATHNYDTINFDKEFAANVTPTPWVDAKVDADLITIQGYAHQEFGFSYLKEGLGSADYDELTYRQMGAPLGQVDLMANWLADLRKKLAVTEASFESRFELVASSLIQNGGYTAAGEKHPTMIYNFNRTKVTTDAGYLGDYVPEIDLSTLNGNGGVGKRAWGSSGGTKAPTPYLDTVKAVKTALRNSSDVIVVMSEDAYDLLEADITANYKTAADTTIAVQTRIELKVLPEITPYEGVMYRRTLPLGNGRSVDIFTYTAGYNDRKTGVFSRYVPDGELWVVPRRNGIKRYGRIKHLGARFQAMERYINTWEDAKTKAQESEIHCSFVMGWRRVDSVVRWKVK